MQFKFSSLNYVLNVTSFIHVYIRTSRWHKKWLTSNHKTEIHLKFRTNNLSRGEWKPARNNYHPITVQEQLKAVCSHGIRGGFRYSYFSGCGGYRSIHPEENLPRWWAAIPQAWSTFSFQRGSFGTDGRKITLETTSQNADLLCKKWLFSLSFTSNKSLIFFSSLMAVLLSWQFKDVCLLYVSTSQHIYIHF